MSLTTTLNESVTKNVTVIKKVTMTVSQSDEKCDCYHICDNELDNLSVLSDVMDCVMISE